VKLLALVFAAAISHAKILMIDLNNADKEVEACKSSAGDSNVVVINQKSLGGKPVSAAAVEDLIAKYEAAGVSFDACQISGHQGSGDFFGGDDEQNHFSDMDLQGILRRHPKTQQSLKMLMLWGCYTGNLTASKFYWMAGQLSNVQSTIGFPMQSPDKESPKNHEALKWACDPDNRKLLEEKASLDQICKMYQNFPLLANAQASISNCQGIASNLYDDDSPANKKACYSYDELEARCGVFDRDNSIQDTYQCYLHAGEGCEDPPLDEAKHEKTKLRLMYDATSLYYHCAGELMQQRKYRLPSMVIAARLVMFSQMKENLSRLNREELKGYDDRLSDLGLSKYALGDISKLTRGEIKRRLENAAAELRRKNYFGAHGTNPRVVEYMNTLIHGTLVQLLPKQILPVDRACDVKPTPNWCSGTCSDFSLVHPNIRDPKRKSQCIVSYEQAEVYLQ
jgi:hypothetical protein